MLVAFWHWGAYFAVTILIISFLVFFHELGHFLAAKQLGVAVNTFSIGFGEKIYTKVIRGTEYAISAIPLGGYVSLKGQEDLDPKAKSNDSDSFNRLTPWGRIYILFAGPFFNLILAFLIYIALGHIGVERLAPTVGKVLENSAASLANLEVGDKILSVNGVKIREWDDISKQIKLEPVKIEVLRNGLQKNFSLTPKIGSSKNIFGEDIEKPLIGISPSGDFITIYNRGFNSIPFAFSQSYSASKLIIQSLEKLLTGAVPAKEIGGIFAISDITTQAAGISLSVLLFLTALISINLGVLNLFPIPVLDGGHIAFNLYEVLFKKPINERVFVGLTYFGLVCLFGFFIFTVINDFLRMTGYYG
ncbi:MAG: RIP metalloprotease RseP [Campylobacter sp.]|nr:RIP metalloprotease RseP [Campylobacter sp.]